MRSSGFALSQLRRVHSEKNGSDTPHQTTMNKLCRESVARCSEMSLPYALSRLPPSSRNEPGQHSEILPLLSMVFFNFSAQEDQTFQTNYSPRLPWPSGDVEFEVLLRGQHIYIPIVVSAFWEAIRRCERHPGGNQPSFVVPTAGC